MTFIDKVSGVWDQAKKALTVLKDVDSLAREFAPPEGSDDTRGPDDTTEDNDTEEKEKENETP